MELAVAFGASRSSVTADSSPSQSFPSKQLQKIIPANAILRMGLEKSGKITAAACSTETQTRGKPARAKIMTKSPEAA
jgi:hypothetical protein